MNNNLIPKPVIFLAFANDKPNTKGYLRDLKKEQKDIKEALGIAIDNNLCEVLVRPNATTKEILTIFQDKSYRDRIVIFHYGGHAQKDALRLKSENGGLTEAYKEGLVELLCQQKELKFVFLNACYSEDQALSLTHKGIPAVVGTATAVSDIVACDLATFFYSGIAQGLPLERAWNEAVAFIKLNNDPKNIDALWQYEKMLSLPYFPWNFRYRKGSEFKIATWNLPDANNNHLFGLPPIPVDCKIPETPFLFLKQYDRPQAQIFFGRSQYIRQLYSKIDDSTSPSIILLYGQSGVGKSSLLKAGLLPRLENGFYVLITHRIYEKGLAGTLEELLDHYLKNKIKNNPPPDQTPLEKWRQLESIIKKPLIIILDQAEEFKTRPNPDQPKELQQLLELLKAIFDEKNDKPKGKFLLCYRKEYHPEILKEFEQLGIPKEPVFLEPLNLHDIIEVITSISNTPRLKAHYHFLEIQENLAETIANDLVADQNSPIAPILQILLTKMWNQQIILNTGSVTFTHPLYQDLKKQGLAMADFLNQQITKLAETHKNEVNSGLALNILKDYTTNLGTSRTLNSMELIKNYDQYPQVENLLQKLIDSFLITRSTDYEEKTAEEKNETSLAHDTLAPEIIKEYTLSDKPGQRASRILTAKVINYKEGQLLPLLDDADLNTVELGQKFMRKWTPTEIDLVQKSQKRRTQKKIIRYTTVATLFIFTIVIFWLWRLSVQKTKETQANYYAAQARILLNQKNPATAIRFAQAAYYLDKNPAVTQVLSEIAAATHEHPFYNLNFSHQLQVCDAIFSPDNQKILTISEDKTAKLWDLQGNLLHTYFHAKPVAAATFSPDGSSFLTIPADNTVRLWSVSGALLQTFHHQRQVNSATFSPDGQKILTASDDYTVKLWHKSGEPLKELIYNNEINSATFSPDGTSLLTVSNNQNNWLLNLQGEPIHSFVHPYHAEFSPTGKYILLLQRINLLKFWDIKNQTLKHLTPFTRNKFIQLATFSPQEQSILITYLGGSLELLDLNGFPISSFTPHKDNITDAHFATDGQTILTASIDKTAKLCNLNGHILKDLHLHQKSINTTALSQDQTLILTASQDYTAKLWDIKNQLLMEFPTNSDELKYSSFSPDGTKIITITANHGVKVWDLRGRLVAHLTKHTKTVNTATFSPDNSHIVTTSTDNTAILWTANGHLLKKLNHSDNVNNAEFSPDGKFILTASYDHTAKLWDIQGNPLSIFPHQKAVLTAHFSPDGRFILTGSLDNTAKIWNLQGKLIKNFINHSFPVHIALFSPDGKKILTVSAAVLIWDIHSESNIELNYLKHLKEKLTMDINTDVTDACFSPDGQNILTAYNNNRAMLWNLQGKLLAQFLHQSKIYQAIFAPDGSRILTSSADKTAKLWDLQGTLWVDFTEHTNHVYSARFSPDGKRIVSTSADNTVKLWYTPEGIINWINASPIPPFDPKAIGRAILTYKK